MWTYLQDHFITFALDLCAAIGGAWVFSRYYPQISDWRSRRSAKAVNKQIARLQSDLNEFQKQLKDTKMYVVHYISEVFGALSLAMLSFFLLVIAFITISNPLSWIIMIFSAVIMFYFWRTNNLALMRLSPERYTERLHRRINHLRQRLPDKANKPVE
jgi:hypothetical protein